MSVANPFFFLLSFFIGAFILLYFFRKQYEQMPISSNMLWEQALHEWQASPWLHKLQHHLLFWLQLLALVLIVIALTRPYWYGKGLLGDHLILVVDTSATMSAKEGEGNRLSAAKVDMLELLADMDDQEVTVIQAGPKPTIVVNHEQDPKVVRKAIQRLELTYEYDAMDKSIALAQSLATTKNSVIHLFSDHIVEDDVAKLPEDDPVFVHNYNSHQNNVSLLSFGTAMVEGTISAVAVASNQTEQMKQVKFTVTTGDKVLLTRNVKVAANAEVTIDIPSLPFHPFYQASIIVNDDYEVDNTLTTIPTSSYDKVYAVGDVNAFFIAGLQTIGLEVVQVDHAAKIGHDGVVIAEAVDLSTFGQSPLLFINSDAKKKQKVTENIKATNDALLTYVDSENIYIESASSSLNGEWPSVLMSGKEPLIQKGTYRGQPIVVLNFALSDTDWPLQPGFPLFLYNSYQWLTQASDFLGYYQPGEEKWLNLDNEQNDVSIFSEDGQHLNTLDLANESFVAPIKPGVYEAVSGEHSYYFSVLLDEREKSLQSAASSFTHNTSALQSGGTVERMDDQLWLWLACIALFLLMLEWEVYRRGY